MPESLIMVLRGGAATTLLLLALILLRDGGNRTLARLGALFALSTAYWALNTQPFADWAYQWAFPLVAISTGKTAAFWLFTRALFDDDFRMRPLDWAVWGTMVAVGGVALMRSKMGLPSDWLQIPHQLGHIALAVSAAWIAWKGRGADLVESRRRSRIGFVLLSALLTVGITAFYLAPGKPPPIVADLNVIRIFVVAIAMALLVSGLRTPEMFGKAAAPAAAGAPLTTAGGDLTEARLLARLQRLMEEERVYRIEGLSIGALAARAEVPEYVLRRLINGRLGHRNFNAYLNGWRLGDARAALLDPAQREVPISTIALDAGFSSLGPFNRAFKEAEGMTPTQFRNTAPPQGAGLRILKTA